MVVSCCVSATCQVPMTGQLLAQGWHRFTNQLTSYRHGGMVIGWAQKGAYNVGNRNT